MEKVMFKKEIKTYAEKIGINIESVNISNQKIVIKSDNPFDLLRKFEPLMKAHGFSIAYGNPLKNGKVEWSYKYREEIKYTPERIDIPGRLIHAIGSITASQHHINKKALENILTVGLKSKERGSGVKFQTGLNRWVEHGQGIAVLDPAYFNVNLSDRGIDNFVEKYFEKEKPTEEELKEFVCLKPKSGYFLTPEETRKIKSELMEIFPSSPSLVLWEFPPIYAAKHPEEPIIGSFAGDAFIPKKYFHVYDLYLEHELVYDEKNGYRKEPVKDEAVLNGVVRMGRKRKNPDFDFFNLCKN